MGRLLLRIRNFVLSGVSTTNPRGHSLRSPAWGACGAVRPAKLMRWLQLRASLGRRPPDHAAAASVLLGLGRIVVSETEAPVLLVNLV